MPHVTHLDCRSPPGCSAITSGIIALIPCLPNLKELCFSPGCFTTATAEAAADHQKLETIRLDHESCFPKFSANNELKPQLKEGAYPSLFKLEIAVTFQKASFLLDTFPARGNLTDLRVYSAIFNESAASIAHFITVTVLNCQCLQFLALSRIDDAPRFDEPDLDESDVDGSSHDEPGDEVVNEKDRVSVDHLRPLFVLQHLIHFEISHQHPLLLRPSDIEEIATSMPNIETLILNNKPSFIKHSNLKLDALFPFARHCSRLHTLGLFMNATVDDRQYTLNDINYPVFLRLCCLDVGYSSVEDENRVAWFLSLISPNLRAVESDITGEKWRAISKVLPLLKKVRTEEQAKLLLTKA